MVVALLQNPHFIDSFIDDLALKGQQFSKKSIKNRLMIIREWLEDKNELLAELYLFSWYAAGLSYTDFGQKPKKFHQNIIDESPILYHFGGGDGFKRIFTETFSYNVGEIWLNPTIEIQKKKTFYHFCTLSGNKIGAIYQAEI
jgi:hypothetical protein